MRVAIIHYWLVNMRGGEKVIESLCHMFPEADIFTHVLDESILSDVLRQHTIKTTFINKLPFSKMLYQSYLPLMPRALESLDLTGYDIVISSESGPAKGVIVPPDALHLCYCHSPMRYLWDQYHIYRSEAGLASKIALSILGTRLRRWDVTSAARVDGFMANSHHVANRIKKYWRREANIVYPPVATEKFSPVPQHHLEDYYLWVGELAPYKRPDLLVKAFNQNGKKLIVIGGPEKTRQRLKKTANRNISFLGKMDFTAVRYHMSRCKALIFPGEEDFGIVPVETMASGRPVVAYGRGGALDTIIEGRTGVLFETQTVTSLNEAIERLETDLLPDLDVEFLVHHARQFSETNFHRGVAEMRAQLEQTNPPAPSLIRHQAVINGEQRTGLATQNISARYDTSH